MLSIILGFGGRIGRLRYFLLTLLLAAVLTAAIFATVIAMLPGPSRSSSGEMPAPLLAIGLLVLTPVYLWFTFALQAKRLRDIGWPPLYVLPAWIGFNAVDALLWPMATGADPGGSTPGVLVDATMILALLFWPGRADDGSEWSPPSFGTRAPAATAPPTVARRAAPPRATSAQSPAAGFGRRRV